MAYINQVQVGSTTYDIRDKRLENPLDFQGVVTQVTPATASTLSWGTGETDQWKVGSFSSSLAYLTPGTTTATVYFGSTVPSGSTRVYPGDLIYAYLSSGATDPSWEVVPSADNPHTHSIPSLSGTAASVGDHHHTYNVPTQAASAGGHSHTFDLPKLTGDVAVTRNTTTGGSATSTFTGTKTNTDEIGGHTHTFTGSAVNTSWATPAVSSVTTGGAHTHTVTYSKASASGSSVPATVSGNTLVFSVAYVTGITNTATEVTTNEKGGHTHTITMSSHSHSVTAAGTLSSAGAHSHSVTATGSITTTIDWPQYVGTATIQAVSGLTTSAVSGHTHELTGTSANKNTGEAGSHSHTVSTTASTTGTGQ